MKSSISNAQKRRQAMFEQRREPNPQPQLVPNANWQTQQRGSDWDEFQIFLHCADDGNGGGSTHGGAPKPAFGGWVNR